LAADHGGGAADAGAHVFACSLGAFTALTVAVEWVYTAKQTG
jgi:hypothetical protein